MFSDKSHNKQENYPTGNLCNDFLDLDQPHSQGFFPGWGRGGKGPFTPRPQARAKSLGTRLDLDKSR